MMLRPVVRVVGAGITLAMASACQSEWDAQQRAALALYVGADSMGAAPSRPSAIKVKARRELVENSAAAMSVAQPGILFTINDSGNDPMLFALDTTGADRGAWRISGATNVDWESASVGTCSSLHATAREPQDPPRCIYIGDTGDNSAQYPTRVIYRVTEPRAERAGFTGELAAEKLTYAYTHGRHDVEAMYVGPDGSVNLITKRPLKDGAGRLRFALVFSIPAAAWGRAAPARADLVDSLPVIPGSVPMRAITDAALAPDARHVAVRTYAQVYVFATDSTTGRVLSTVVPSMCNIAGIEQRPGEGIGWYGEPGRFVLTSEGRKSMMHVVDCPLPRR